MRHVRCVVRNEDDVMREPAKQTKHEKIKEIDERHRTGTNMGAMQERLPPSELQKFPAINTCKAKDRIDVRHETQ